MGFTLGSLDQERSKIGLIRIVLGLVMVHRFSMMAFTAYYYFPPGGIAQGGGPTLPFWVAVSMVGIGLCVAAGFLTPLATLAAIALQHWADQQLVSTTLGTRIHVLALTQMLFLNAGLAQSIDRVLMRRVPLFGAVVGWLYRPVGIPDERLIRTVYACGFFAFAVISAGAVLFHVDDRAWSEGTTLLELFTTPYLNEFPALFLAWEQQWPAGFLLFSQTGIAGQSLFQVFMIPLMFFKWGRRFVIFWGYNFFIMSLIFIQISTLPTTEVAFWTMTLIPGNRLARYGMPVVRGVPPEAAARPLSRRIPIAYFATLIVVFVLVFPKIYDELGKYIIPGRRQQEVKHALRYVGLELPNVFNRADLRMGYQWWVGYRVYDDGTEEIVPLNAKDGGRLWYHLSDTLYFGNSLRWRRRNIGRWMRQRRLVSDPTWPWIRRALIFDYRFHDRKPEHYRLEFYKRHAHGEIGTPRNYVANVYFATDLSLETLDRPPPPRRRRPGRHRRRLPRR